jgi:enoyl-CoA hydratase
VEKADLEETARTVAAEIAANAPLAVQGVKHDIDAYAEAPVTEALDRTALSAALTLTSDDAAEGYAARGARRVPRFEGK